MIDSCQDNTSDIPYQFVSRVVIEINFLICNTARSGTNLLCRYMNACFHGIRGVTEWYTGGSENALEGCRRAQSEQIGACVHGCYLPAFSDYIARNGYRITERTKHVHLTRLDKIRQAISELKARHGDQVFDNDQIFKYIEYFCCQEHLWMEYFKSNTISPLYICYEQLDREPVPTLKKIADYLGTQYETVLPTGFDEIRSTGRRSNNQSEEWVHMFLSERKNKYGDDWI